MKKLLLFTVAAAMSFCGFAQNIRVAEQPLTKGFYMPHTAAKATWTSDSFYHTRVSNGDTLSLYYTLNSASIYTADLGNPPFDSGYIFGNNIYGLNAFANYFKAKGGDTTIKIIGIQTYFTGTVQPASINKIRLKVWKADTGKVDLRPTYHLRGLPLVPALDSMDVSYKNLGIGVGAAPDSGKVVWFTGSHPNIAAINFNFLVGYEMAYTWGATQGDTIGSCSTGGTQGHGCNVKTIVAGDTTLQVQTLFNTGTGWTDVALGFTGSPAINLSIIPIVLYTSTAGVHTISQHNMTYYGTFPNPATNSTNVKFELNSATDVTVQVMDMTGRVLNTITQSNVSAGEHIIPVETSKLASGNYVILFKTADGDGIGSQFTVAK